MREALEEMMSHFGDNILRLMHKQDLPARAHNTSSLMEFLMQNPDEECKQLQRDV